MVTATPFNTPKVQLSPAIAGLRPALAAWSAFAALVCAAAWVGGANPTSALAAAALAVCPAGFTLVLLSRIEALWAQTTALAAWVAAGTAAVALCGAGSPMAATLVIAPVLAHRLGGRTLAVETTMFAATGLVLAMISARGGAAFDAPAPEAFALASIALAGWVLALPSEAPPTISAPGRIAEAAHEMRTPLNHIIGFADMMTAQVFGPLPAKYAEYAELIAESGKRMLAMVNDWLDAGRLAEGRYAIVRESVDLSVIAAEAARAAAVAFPERRAPSVETPGPVVANVDPRACRQILDNLVSNAMKFSPPEAAVRVWVRAVGARAFIEVADEGPGVTDAEKATLAQPYARGAAGERVSGTGLGLMLVRALATAHAGGLDILDAPGGGALMRVSLGQREG